MVIRVTLTNWSIYQEMELSGSNIFLINIQRSVLTSKQYWAGTLTFSVALWAEPNIVIDVISQYDWLLTRHLFRRLKVNQYQRSRSDPGPLSHYWECSDWGLGYQYYIFAEAISVPPVILNCFSGEFLQKSFLATKQQFSCLINRSRERKDNSEEN